MIHEEFSTTIKVGLTVFVVTGCKKDWHLPENGRLMGKFWEVTTELWGRPVTNTGGNKHQALMHLEKNLRFRMERGY